MEIDLFTTDQLINALGRRFKHVLVATSGEYDDTPGKMGSRVHWRGGPIAALGLAEYAKDRILHEEEVPADTDDFGNQDG